MKEKMEILLAWDILNLIWEFMDLIYDRYENEFLEIYLREEDQKFLTSLKNDQEPPNPFEEDTEIIL